MNRHSVKVCAQCGCAEGKNWIRHWSRKDHDATPSELQAGNTPTRPMKGWFEALPADLQSLHQKGIFANGGALTSNLASNYEGKKEDSFLKARAPTATGGAIYLAGKLIFAQV